MLTTLRAAAVTLLAVSSVSACAKPATTDQGQPVPTMTVAPAPSVSNCPVVKVPTPAWPIEIPADLPKPPQAVIRKVDHNADGLTVVRFDASISLREGVVFMVESFKASGWALGRGDAEPREADAPFSRGDYRGVFRLVATGDCATTWLLAVSPPHAGGQGPTLPNYHATSSASPLPFG